VIEIGEIINQRYRVVAEIGRGGMGVVFCSHDTLLDRDVAIKVLTEPDLDAEVHQRLMSEAQAVARLNHPNVVSVYDAGDYLGSPFLVMELVEGELLSEVVPRPVDEVIFISRQICMALDHAHNHGIVHRDLKPENVILLPDGTAKLMDFGVAWSGATQLMQEGEIIGTVFYLAPEQALGEQIDQRADLYALGVILYELLTGQLPFFADDMLSVISQHLKQPVIPPSDKNPQIPASFDSLVLHLLSKDKADRPSSALEVLKELNRISEEMGLGVARVSGERSLPEVTPEKDQHDTLPDFLVKEVQQGKNGFVPFVCREQELERLNHALEDMISGHGGLRFISGDTGRGKTSLVVEFARQGQRQHPDLIVAIGSSDAITGMGDPYLPFRDILSLLTGGIERQWAVGNLNREQAVRIWEFLPTAVKVLVERGSNLIDKLIPAQELLSRIAHHASIDSAFISEIESTLASRQDLAGRAIPEQSSIFEEYTEVLRTLADTRPLLLIFEDLHWADTSSLSLLFHLGKRVGRSKILILGTYRPQEIFRGEGGTSSTLQNILSEFKRDAGDIWIDLDQEDQESARRFVDAYLDAIPNHLSDDFRYKLSTVTGGNPLFTTELIKDLKERGDIFKDEDGTLVEGPEVSWDILPVKVEGVIEKRIERLDQSLREVLAVASVEGEIFTAEVIAKIIDRDKRQVIKMLSSELMGKQGLIIEGRTRRIDSRQLSQYVFRHNLTQYYLYHNLGVSRRFYLHEAVGTELENLYGAETEEIALQLSRHFQEAGIPVKAIHYLYQAGVRALKLSAPREAVVHLSEGLDKFKANRAAFESTDRQRDAGRLLPLKFERRLAEAYYGMGELSNSLMHLENLMRLLGRPVPRSQIRLFASFLWQVLKQLGHLILPGPFPRRMHEGAPYNIEAVRGYYQLSEIYFLYNKPLHLIYALLTTLNLSERLEPSSELSWAYAGVANVVGLIPVHFLANRYITQARKVVNKLDNPYDRAYVNLVVSLYTSGFGYSASTQADLESALEVFEKGGYQRRIGETLATLAVLATFQGDLARCQALYEQLLSMGLQRENELFEAWALDGLAELDIMRAEVESAADKLERARELLKENIDRSEEVRATGLLAKASLISGNYDRALKLAEEGYQLIVESMPPTVFSMVVGYAGVAEVFLRLWELQLSNPNIVDISTAQLRSSAHNSVKNLGSFSREFKAGTPNKLLWGGAYDWLEGNQRKALKKWRDGLKVAESLQMPYEAGLLHFEIARRLDTDNPDREIHIQAAQDIFSRLGASANLAAWTGSSVINS
jgi:serine/threonine protein kinase/tetratricopeptide (TPR) repeat protein